MKKCIKNNLKDPKMLFKLKELAGSRHLRSGQIRDILCNHRSAQSQKIVSALSWMINADKGRKFNKVTVCVISA